MINNQIKEESIKNSLMLFFDKILLRKRVLVETVCDELKNIWLILKIMMPVIKPLK